MNNDVSIERMELDDARSMMFRGCNSYDRLPALIDISPLMDSREWLLVLGEIWENCDNISNCMEYLFESTPFAELTKNPLAWRDHMMTVDERAALAKLPQHVTIYRGCFEHNKDGLSWTINRHVAASFPFLHRYRSRGAPMLIKASIPRDHILAFKNDRGEEEVIAWRPEIQRISYLTKP
ncbi:MAG: hypothetical protein VYD90_19380 [Pseudomonadota bacterium]|nr:hypothetical protein [Pseudomonadota bacterium]